MKQIFLTITLALTILAGANAKNRIKVACIGNSITYGMTLDNPAAESYPAQLQTMLGESYEVGNFGKSGATLTRNGYRPYTMQEEYKRALDFAGDIVVIHLGINDTDPRVWPHLADEFVGDYLELIASLRSANPSALFYIARLSPISDRHPRFKSGTRDWRDQIQAMIENVAEASGAQLIDFESPLIDKPWMLPDGLHPNKEGATQLAKTVYSAITGDFGGLNMPEIYTDGMVLPAGRGLTISGTANAGDRITLTIGSQSVSSTTGANGTWSIDLLPLKAGETYEMTVSDGNSSIRFTDIAAGAVWLASGQSNMQFSLKETDTALQDIQMANTRNVRFYNMKPRWMTYPGEWTEGALDSVNRLQYYQDTQWQSCTPETAADFSAIGYYFGRMLADSLNIPVGIICNAVGGSPTESWIDRTNLEHNFPDILSSPNTNDFIQPWVRDRAKENTARATSTLQRHPFHPAYLYESGISPISSYPIDGVIWYQGESNAHNIEAHDRLFGMVIDSWRNTWKNPKLPFLFVQLSSLNRSSWPAFRNSQYWFAHNKENENVYMVISSDHGDSTDVHPRCKRPIGERLARVALRNQYGFDKLTAFAPSPVKAEFFGDSVFIHMTDEHPEHLLATSDNKAPSSFEAAYYEGIFFPANAEISSDSTAIILSCDSLPAIRHIRYGWQPFTHANLINNAGLPVSTFKISDENSPAQSTAISVESLPSLKGSSNYSKGVSAAFAGRLGNRTVVAGGANFPDVPAAKGGKKAYYDDVYYLPDGGKKWMKAKGRLPYKVAYGASFTTAEGIICAGGITPDGPTDRVFCMNVNADGSISIMEMPKLPAAIDNAGAAFSDNVLYIIGGNINGQPSKAIYSLDLNSHNPEWQNCSTLEGNARTQPATAATRHAIIAAGGFAPKYEGHTEPTLDTDAIIFHTDGTKEHTCVPDYISLGGGTATAVGRNKVLFTGGVNGKIFLDALKAVDDDYLTHPAEWYRFNRHILMLDIETMQWTDFGEFNETARAGAMAVSDGNNGVILIGGELKPGVRTSSVIRISVSD